MNGRTEMIHYLNPTTTRMDQKSHMTEIFAKERVEIYQSETEMEGDYETE